MAGGLSTHSIGTRPVALLRFRDDGGAVILLGSADADPAHVDDLDHLARRLNTDRRLADDGLGDVPAAGRSGSRPRPGSRDRSKSRIDGR